MENNSAISFNFSITGPRNTQYKKTRKKAPKETVKKLNFTEIFALKVKLKINTILC